MIAARKLAPRAGDWTAYAADYSRRENKHH
jgi:hypothetical protein